MSIADLGRWLRPILRRWLGSAHYCAHCSARLDAGLKVFEVASPSRLAAEHALGCPTRGPLAFLKDHGMDLTPWQEGFLAEAFKNRGRSLGIAHTRRGPIWRWTDGKR